MGEVTIIFLEGLDLVVIEIFMKIRESVLEVFIFGKRGSGCGREGRGVMK
jgi:hypothetical protein